MTWGVGSFALVSILLVTGLPREAQAQGGKKSGGGMSQPGGKSSMPGMGMQGMGGGGMPMSGPGGMSGRGSMPPMSGMGGMSGAGMPGMSNAGGAGVRARRGVPDEKRPPLPELKLDPNGLPAGFTPSQEPPEWMTTTDEAPKHRFEELEEQQPREWRQLKNRITNLIKQTGVFGNDEDKKLIDEYVDYRLTQMTRKENRLGGKNPAHELQDRFYREINPTTLQRGDKSEVRLHMANKIVALAPQYLNNYHFVSRLQTIILLARLSEVVETPGEGNRIPDVHFTRALTELLNVARQDKSTVPAGVRTWALVGLVRLALLPELKGGERNRVIETLVEQLNKSSDEPWWNQWRLVEGLGRIRATSLADKRPAVAQALARALVDTERDWLVRSEAAYALGQLNYERDIDLGLIAFEIGRLVEQMDQALLQTSTDQRWKLCYIKVYGAFKPIEDDGQGLLKQVQERAALAAFKKPVSETYDKILPIVDKVVKDPESITAPHEDLVKWLSANAPKGDRIHSSEEPLHGGKPIGAAGPAGPPAAGG